MDFVETSADLSQIETAILFASYERRSITVAKNLYDSGFRGNVNVLFCEDLPPKRIKSYLDEIIHFFGNRTKMVPVSYHNPIPAIEAARNLNWTPYMLIDASCFNRGNLFPFLWSSQLGRLFTSDVTFAYSAPESYGDWLSADYGDPRNIVGFSGGLEFGRDRVLICIVGFEATRALAVIQSVEPSKVILTVGTIPTREQFCARNQHTVEELHGSKNYEIRNINVSDPGACMKDLKEILEEFPPETEISFAPFSTKLSCLAIWALWLENTKIRVWNAQPKTYNLLNYSKGSLAPRYFRVNWTTTQK